MQQRRLESNQLWTVAHEVCPGKMIENDLLSSTTVSFPHSYSMHVTNRMWLDMIRFHKVYTLTSEPIPAQIIVALQQQTLSSFSWMTIMWVVVFMDHIICLIASSTKVVFSMRYFLSTHQQHMVALYNVRWRWVISPFLQSEYTILLSDPNRTKCRLDDHNLFDLIASFAVILAIYLSWQR